MLACHFLSNFTLEQPQGVFLFCGLRWTAKNTSVWDTSATGG